MADFSLQWSQFGAAVAAVGAFGVAAFGLVESAGKAIAFNGFGLPYAGFGTVKHAIRNLKPALKVAYGDDYMEIISYQYRAGRSTGSAPDTIRQGVRLGLPFMSVEAVTPSTPPVALAPVLPVSGASSTTAEPLIMVEAPPSSLTVIVML